MNKRLFSSFLLFFVFLSSQIFCEEDLINGYSYTYPYEMVDGELRIARLKGKKILNNDDFLSIVSNYSEATGLRLCATSELSSEVTWENGLKPALLAMSEINTLSFELDIPKDFFQSILNFEKNEQATSKIATFQAYGCDINLKNLLVGFQHLQKMVFYECNFSGMTPMINNQINDLRLWDSRIGDAELSIFADSLPNLKSFRIAECDFSHTHDEWRNASEKRFTDNTIEVLASLHNLEELSILTSNDKYFVPNDFPKFVNPVVICDYPFHRYIEITDAGFASIGKIFPQLRELRLGKIINVGDVGVFQLSENLEILHLEGFSERFTDNGLRHIINSLSKLEKLTIGGYRALHSEKVNFGIKYLYIPIYCHVSENVFKDCKNLNIKKLHLLYCDEIKNESLNDLVKALPNLDELSLTNCPNITEEGLNVLKKIKPDLAISLSNPDLGVFLELYDD